MEIEKGKYNHKKWNWKLTETINPMLSEKEISNLINKMKEICCINTETAV